MPSDLASGSQACRAHKPDHSGVLQDARLDVNGSSGVPGSCNSGELNLPLSTWLARKLVNTDHLSSNPPIIHRLIRSLSWFIIRRLALWEDIFIRSKLYRVLKKLTPSVLPASSAYPFVISLLIVAIQIRKLWIWQRQSLIQAIITTGPILSTINLLMRLQHPALSTVIEKAEITRWLSYWLIYSSVCNLESIKALSKSSSPSQTYPHLAIYPPSPSRKTTSFDIPLRTLEASKQWLRNYLARFIHSRLNRKRPFPEPRPYMHPAPSTSIRLENSAPFLHEKLFGQHNVLYSISKVLFLRWCSSNTNRGSEVIWTHLLSPLISLISPDPSSKPNPKREMKMVVVSEPVHPEVSSAPPTMRPAADLTQDIAEGSGASNQQDSARRAQPDPLDALLASDDLDQNAKTEETLDSCRTNLSKRPLFINELRTPDNAWDTLSYVS